MPIAARYYIPINPPAVCCRIALTRRSRTERARACPMTSTGGITRRLVSVVSRRRRNAISTMGESAACCRGASLCAQSGDLDLCFVRVQGGCLLLGSFLGGCQEILEGLGAPCWRKCAQLSRNAGSRGAFNRLLPFPIRSGAWPVRKTGRIHDGSIRATESSRMPRSLRERLRLM